MAKVAMISGFDPQAAAAPTAAATAAPTAAAATAAPTVAAATAVEKVRS